jgi:predicted nucleic acid-binding protein
MAMINPLLIDSSFLFELSNTGSPKHRMAVSFLNQNRQLRLIPDVVLTETCYLLKVRISQRAVENFLDSLESPSIQLEAVTKADVKQARQIMARYESANLDFVDCCIVAIAERLNIVQVCTFDRRDFSIFRPTHCEYLELLP